MVTDTDVLLIATDIVPSPETRSHVLLGHDFRTDQAAPVLDLEGGIYAVTGMGAILIPQPELHRMHVWNQGWSWVTLHPEKYPHPPFLLTRQGHFRYVYEGEVSLCLSELVQEDVDDELSRNESLDLPVLGEQFVGVVSIGSARPRRARLIAYSAEAIRLPDTLGGLALGDEARTPFGTISLGSVESGQVG